MKNLTLTLSQRESGNLKTLTLTLSRRERGNLKTLTLPSPGGRGDQGERPAFHQPLTDQRGGW